MPRSRITDSNLFAIDHEAIRKTLAEANKSLLKRCDDLLAAFSRVPEDLNSDENIQRAKLFARQLNEAAREARDARLSDGRPFRDATSTVKAFFDEIENPLQSASQSIVNRLTAAAQESRRTQSAPPLPEPPAPLGIDSAGEVVVTSSAQSSSTSPDYGSEIPLVWAVQSFDRSVLDLEALRDYLTDASILAACRKHLAIHGPHKIDGVKYEEVAEPS